MQSKNKINTIMQMQLSIIGIIYIVYIMIEDGVPQAVYSMIKSVFSNEEVRPILIGVLILFTIPLFDQKKPYN